MTDNDNPFIHFAGIGTLTREAFQLHTFSGIHSVRAGYPGFIDDDYLNSVNADTTTAVAELEAAGLWSRSDGGYVIVADDLVRFALDFDRRMDRAASECEVRGAHVPVTDGRWTVCEYCTTVLKRPPPGPVGQAGREPSEPNLQDDL